VKQAGKEREILLTFVAFSCTIRLEISDKVWKLLTMSLQSFFIASAIYCDESWAASSRGVVQDRTCRELKNDVPYDPRKTARYLLVSTK
jgi:hypothetical protein